jgi:hypothetical protein
MYLCADEAVWAVRMIGQHARHEREADLGNNNMKYDMYGRQRQMENKMTLSY